MYLYFSSSDFLIAKYELLISTILEMAIAKIASSRANPFETELFIRFTKLPLAVYDKSKRLFFDYLSPRYNAFALDAFVHAVFNVAGLKSAGLPSEALKSLGTEAPTFA